MRPVDERFMMLSLENRNDILELASETGPCYSMTPEKKKSKRPRIPKIFDRNPELKKKVEAYLDKIPKKKKEEDLKKFEKFVAGEMTWAEIKGYPKALLKLLAQTAYMKFKSGDYKLAESLFKGLSVIDHTNWYYRTALGAIYQKQKLYDQAIEEFNIALSLNDKEISSFTNRGECYLNLENYAEALKDFEAAVSLDEEGKNAWGNRARVLKRKLIDEGYGEELGE